MNTAQNNQLTGRIKSFDYLKAACMMMVILDHLPLSFKLDYYSIYWLSPAVPIFIIISSYLLTAEQEVKKKLSTVKKHETSVNLIRKIVRVLLPAFILWGTLFYWKNYSVVNMPLSETLKNIFSDSFMGPGNYYIFIYLQLIILFPLFFILYHKGIFVLYICIFFNILWDLSQSVFLLPIYQPLLFRYIICILSGIFLYYYQNKIKFKILLPLVGLSMFATYLFTYDYSFFPYNWKRTLFYAVPYAFLFVYLALKYQKKYPWHNPLVLSIGQSTYYIFLFQIFWFSCLSPVILSTFSIQNVFYNTIISLFVCCSAGIFLHLTLKKFFSLKKHLNSNLKKKQLLSL